ncbi:MAG: primosomal protein N', partial [Bdellovibrionales bacterium]|nr:primosomal protein N' [Bdellovibrionales bacterium]
ETESTSKGSMIEVVIPPLAEGFTYSVSQTYKNLVQVGSKVEVPLGRRRVEGYVSRMLSESDPHPNFELKPIDRLLQASPCFHEDTLRFYEWIARYYCTPLGKVLETAIPGSMPPKTEKQWFTTDAIDQRMEIRGAKQRELLAFVAGHGKEGVSHHALSKFFPHASAPLKRLLEMGLIAIEEREEDFTKYLEHPLEESLTSSITLNERQLRSISEIVSAIDSKQYHSFLLHGVTGSGKTEVYIEAAQHVLSQNGSIMVLVPEIALTPQLVDRFRAKLKDPIAVLHSNIPKRKRWECWRALQSGNCRIALGARSTVFAPMKNLSLIIVDEEHDGSYKQGDGLRYHARDLALVRGSLENAAVILGSATPSVETFYNASIKKHRYLRLKERPFQNEKLAYTVVNLNKIRRKEMPSPSISPTLFEAIGERLIRKEQVFLLYNRRGFARYMQCRACGEVVFCPNCSVPLTFHQVGNKLLCHYCSFNATPSRYCPSCSHGSHHDKEPLLEMRGTGTQKILEELQELFPQAKIARLDRDTTERLDQLEETLEKVKQGEIDILAGTQMIAKGHDLPEVTLVGIIDCDVGLHMPDFRAGERIFQLLTQAGGRAGRRELPGSVILQTRIPTHPSIVLTTKEDYHEFAKRELTLRMKLRYPPFARLARVVAATTVREVPLQYLGSLRAIIDDWCRENEISLECIGPAITPIEKVKALYRAHLIIRADKSGELQRVIGLLKQNVKPPKDLRLTYDIDPQDML